MDRERLVGDVMMSSHLVQSDHQLLGFSVLSEVRRGTSRTLPWTLASRLWPVEDID